MPRGIRKEWIRLTQEIELVLGKQSSNLNLSFRVTLDKPFQSVSNERDKAAELILNILLLSVLAESSEIIQLGIDSWISYQFIAPIPPVLACL